MCVGFSGRSLTECKELWLFFGGEGERDLLSHVNILLFGEKCSLVTTDTFADPASELTRGLQSMANSLNVSHCPWLKVTPLPVQNIKAKEVECAAKLLITFISRNRNRNSFYYQHLLAIMLPSECTIADMLGQRKRKHYPRKPACFSPLDMPTINKIYIGNQREEWITCVGFRRILHTHFPNNKKKILSPIEILYDQN